MKKMMNWIRDKLGDMVDAIKERPRLAWSIVGAVALVWFSSVIWVVVVPSSIAGFFTLVAFSAVLGVTAWVMMWW